LIFATLVASYLWIFMARENKRRDALLAQEKDTDAKESLSSEETRRLGDRDINYRYVL
jgi:hypothetical protein